MRLKIQKKLIGFSLVEMAIVLAIMALLLGGLLPTISTQIEQQRRNETSKLLNEIRDALYGFVIINGYLPCPTTIADPSQANYGVAAASCSANPAAEGFLPWKTLGVTETDAWSGKRIVTASPGYWRYRVDRNFANSGVPVTLSTSFSADALTIKDSNGNDLNTASERPLVIVFSTGPNLTGDEQNASPNTEVPGIFRSDVPSGNFDDILIWISRPQLFNRMVAAGKLP